MTTRRQFFISTIAAAALPNCAFGTARPAAGAIKTISETQCKDGALFSRHCNADSATIDHDPAALLFELEAELSAGRIDAIAGLTRPSTRFLIEQCAARYGCFLSYHGDHRYGADELVHELHLAHGAAQVLERRLASEPQQWARALAGSFDLLGDSTGFTDMITFAVPLATATASRRQLASWMLRKYA